MNKLIRGFVVAAALVAGTALIGAPSANAAAGDGTCTYAESCVFLSWNYAGGMADLSSTDSDWRNNYFSTGSNLNDKGSSGFGMERALKYSQGISFTGASFILGLNQYDPIWSTDQPNASSSSYNFNDQVSSHSIWVP